VVRIGFVINDIGTELAEYTRVRLARAATNLGHEAWLMGVGDFVYDPDGSIHASARAVPERDEPYDDQAGYLEALRGADGRAERLAVDDLDVVLLRNDPAADADTRPWAQTCAVLFAQLAVRRGTIVLNDPANLANALNKTYFQHFPEEVRPRTLITRDTDEIRRFVDEQGGRAVAKPLQGSGGRSVFLLKDGDAPNINQIIDAIRRDGYVVVQEYLEAASEGDIRLFVMNGEALQHEGKYAAIRRVNRGDDMRSNISAGGSIAPVEIGETELRLVDMVRPKLIYDGMFLVGLDIVGDKLMEVNVFSPGGLGSVMKTTGVDFCPLVIGALERKIAFKAAYGSNINNVAIATL
jgi:glutathione synthase